MLQETGMNSKATYIGLWKATVAQWVSLKPILEVYTLETGYEGGGRNRQLWWRQGTTAEALVTTLEEA